ncbi:phospholipid carrier-dependent glycosyltransferase [Actinomyces sp. MRS3W]|uniref:phospholipid carrier-dependent glycosyltransferase n=1 Tax=Actinomyces sp. MRS3W TaxID=2800796 RepID=UPI0028FD5F25|nr:phospholipid carrier-dependent glycosyltransferase [Actinomyces sp. MRS3W]MDU0349577.1 phospholipid carrier-dependent glycosyltransferase [Actinomyces sp. MRS3W]
MGVALAIGLFAFVVAVLQIMRVTEISPIDEATHIDYVWRIMHGELPHRGDLYTSFTLEEWSCRKQASVYAKLPECGVTDPSQFGVIMENYNAWQPPGLFAVVALMARIGMAITSLDPVTLMRVSCALIVAVGLAMVYALMRMWSLPRGLAAAVTLLLLTNPFTLMVATTVSTDAPFLIFGVLSAIVLTRELSGKSAALLALIAGACAGLVKTITLASLVIVLGVLCLIAVVRLVRGRDRWREPLLTVAAGVFGGGLVTLLWGRYVAAHTPSGWENRVLGQNNTEYVGLPFDEWLPTLTHVFGYTSGSWEGSPVTTYHGQLLTNLAGLALTVAPFCGLIALRGRERLLAGIAAVAPVLVVLLVQVQSWVREEVYFPIVSARYGVTLIPLTALVLGLLLKPLKRRGQVVVWCLCGLVLILVVADSLGVGKVA